MAVKEQTWSNKRPTDEGKQLSTIKHLIFCIRYGRLGQPKQLQNNNHVLAVEQGSYKKGNIKENIGRI